MSSFKLKALKAAKKYISTGGDIYMLGVPNVGVAKTISDIVNKKKIRRLYAKSPAVRKRYGKMVHHKASKALENTPYGSVSEMFTGTRKYSPLIAAPVAALNIAPVPLGTPAIGAVFALAKGYERGSLPSALAVRASGSRMADSTKIMVSKSKSIGNVAINKLKFKKKAAFTKKDLLLGSAIGAIAGATIPRDDPQLTKGVLLGLLGAALLIPKKG